MGFCHSATLCLRQIMMLLPKSVGVLKMFNSLDCVRNVILNFVFKITSKTNGLKTFKKLMIIIDK